MSDTRLDIDAVEVLARRAQNAEPVDFTDDYHLPEAVAVRVVRQDERIETTDLEKLEPGPREQRGTAKLHDDRSFAAYVNRLKTPATTMWANDLSDTSLPTVTAVFNDHTGAVAEVAVRPSSEGEDSDREPTVLRGGNAAYPGWRDHTAQLQVTYDEDWRDWRDADDKLMPQKAFATFLLDHQHTLGAEQFGQVMKAVSEFRSMRNVKHQSTVDLRTGVHTFTFEEQNAGSQQWVVQLPDKIVIRTWVYAGGDDEAQKVDVEALLRYQEPGDAKGSLQLAYKIVRPAAVEREAWRRIVADIAATVPDVPMLQGAAPAALREVPRR